MANTTGNKNKTQANRTQTAAAAAGYMAECLFPYARASEGETRHKTPPITASTLLSTHTYAAVSHPHPTRSPGCYARLLVLLENNNLYVHIPKLSYVMAFPCVFVYRGMVAGAFYESVYTMVKPALHCLTDTIVSLCCI